MRNFGSIDLPSDALLNKIFFDPFFISCSNVLFRLSVSVNNFFLDVVDICSFHLFAQKVNPVMALEQLSESNIGTFLKWRLSQSDIEQKKILLVPLLNLYR